MHICVEEWDSLWKGRESWLMCSTRDQPKVWYCRSFDLTANQVVLQVLSLFKRLTTSVLFKFYPKVKILNSVFVCILSAFIGMCSEGILADVTKGLEDNHICMKQGTIRTTSLMRKSLITSKKNKLMHPL